MIGSIRVTSSWIDFKLVGNTGKTQTWDVVTTYDGGGTVLGKVKWFGRWRRYAFFPAAGTVYEPTCLGDIISFIEKVMEERREQRRRQGAETHTTEDAQARHHTDTAEDAKTWTQEVSP